MGGRPGGTTKPLISVDIEGFILFKPTYLKMSLVLMWIISTYGLINIP
jgi:hypothetical protein